MADAGCVLAGDIGGTKTDLALYSLASPVPSAPLRERSFASHTHLGLEEIVGEFLRQPHPPIGAAAFGVAGPVLDGVVRVTNLPWRVDALALGRAVGCPRVRLLNDLETTAYGALLVSDADMLTLNAGTPRAGNRAVIAAGTGLGEALLLWDGQRHHPSATEGGHVDFGPRDEREDGLLRFLRAEFGRVSWERVVSGPGLHNIFRYLAEGLRRPVEPAVQARLTREDPSAAIGALGVAGTCPICVEAVELFVSLYGAQAGNLALTAMAVGGVYVGGGIVTKLLPVLTRGAFRESFIAKPPHRALLEQIPLRVLLNPKTSLIGAAHAARDLLGEPALP